MTAAPKLPVSAGPLHLTPSQVDDLVALKLSEVCAGIAEWKLPMAVTGVLGDLPQGRYGGGKLYRVPLADAAAPASVTHLDVRGSVLEQAQAGPGDLVRATGIIVPNLFKGTVSFRLDAVALELAAPTPAPASDRETPNAITTLRRLGLDRRPFPDQAAPRITLIHPSASDAKVADDFLGALGAAGAGSPVQRVPVSMHDPAAIVAALRGVRPGIVALVRGGGDAASFAVFEHVDVLEALAKCGAYRVLGLGHTANRTLAELVADHAASTPTAAGEHVRRAIESTAGNRSTAGRVRELNETLVTRDMELAYARKALERPREPEPVEPPPVVTMRPRLMPVVVVSVAVGAIMEILFWLLLHRLHLV